MQLEQFDYYLPKNLVAYRPSKIRGQSKMMVVQSKNDEGQVVSFDNFDKYLSAGDCLVLNDTKVIPARLFGHKESGGKVEALLINTHQEKIWKIMARPTKHLKVGTKIFINKEKFYTIIAKNKDGTCDAQFNDEIFSMLDSYGEIPLPPYINRSSDEDDKKRYQTVFAKKLGAVAAPTAGLHLTSEKLTQLEAKGVEIVYLTLHVGAGTFLPVSSDDISNHKMHSEAYSLNQGSAEILNNCRKTGHKIFAIGTTTVRVLENCATEGTVTASSGWTNIFLYPPYKMQFVDGLLTNFHFPKSTLLMLVSCLTGRAKLLQLYEQAIQEKMRFFSYGDCMLILP